METPPTTEPRHARAPASDPTLTSLMLVLPADNEAERIGPALDELFAFLDREASADCSVLRRCRPRRPGRSAARWANDQPSCNDMVDS